MNLDAKVNAIINASPGADSSSDGKGGAPPSASSSGAESAPGAADVDAGSGSQSPAGTPGAPTLADIMAAKYAKVVEDRKASRVLAKARAERGETSRLAAEAKADRDAAAAEAKRWNDLKTGNILETIKASGRNPREVFEQLTAEALEAGTPEAQMRRMKEEMDRQLADLVEPLKKTVEELTAEKKAQQEHAIETARQNDFNRHVTAAAYESLRDEYPPERLYGFVKALIESPDEFYKHQERFKVRLTTPGDGYNMQDILNVLKSVSDEHYTGVEKRRATRTAPNPSDAAPNAAPSLTVNGTAERRDAGTTTIGNDLATGRAADGKFIPRGATASQRIRERARRLSGE
jgi:hypothetical protein